VAYIVVCIATRWGSALGGINVFNTGLAQGIANILPKPGQCICAVEKKSPTDLDSKVRLLEPPEWEAKAVADVVFDEIERRPSRDVEEVLVLGHDMHTGTMAVECARQLKRLMGRNTPVSSAVVSHMAYREYARRKGQGLTEVDKKSEAQHAIVGSADYAFSVGPLLADSFQSARTQRSDQVISLTPGASNIDTQPEKAQSLSFYIGGRLGLEDDQIKNGVLSVHAVLAAYAAERQTAQPGRWRTRGHFYACGVDSKDEDLLNQLRAQARKDAAFEIEAVPFSDHQHEVHRHLAKCDIALMPSWHEGFGLAGWEAMCAGVPLICSSQSGLALLIEYLQTQLPDANFHSIEYVQLAGGSPAGMPSDQDIDTVSLAVRSVIADYPARKRAALSLALRIKRRFTWDECALTLVAPLKWPLATSRDWSLRQQAADVAAERSESESGTEFVLEALEACKSGQIERKWELVCSALNWFSDRGSEARIIERYTLRSDLVAIGNAIADALSTQRDVESLPVVDTVFLDLCWRYLAAASRVATTFGEFAALLLGAMRERIFNDGFLRRELLFYVCRFASEFDGKSDEQATDFLNPLTRNLSDDRSLLVRLARLSTVYPSLRRLMPLEGNVEFDIEMKRCVRALSRSFDLSQLLNQSPDLAPTVLALSSLKPDLARQSIDQPIGFVKRLAPKYAGTWRGDKRLAAGMVTVGLSSHNVLAVLESMASDEEEAIRWAALDLAFSPVLRARLVAMEEETGGTKVLCTNLGKIVDVAVTTGDAHPWLAREFLNHYREEYVAATELPAHVSKFTLADFPRSRELFGPVVGYGESSLVRPMHPDVEGARKRAFEIFKRVLLVLPPISVDPTEGRAASKTSTPALGLGLLASHLSQQGHDVHLVDCHRFPYLAHDVTRRAETFDLIGFNTVFSTVRATQRMLSSIRGATQRPMLVVGGPAANLGGWQYSALNEADVGNWDFAVAGDAVSNLQRLVDALKTSNPWPVGDGLLANTHSALVARRDLESPIAASASIKRSSTKDLGWMAVQLDRRMYAGPGGQYEPGRTRDLKGRVFEAHIVMSKGCDWNCSFCTEQHALSGGERRREVESVLQEIRQLAAKHTNLRIQFIDDNLFPQIASNHNASDIKREEGKAWAVQFLHGLTQIRDELGGNLSWRGIFRLEDFAAYEALGPEDSFVSVLIKAGCNMLAFGVESGDEARRHLVKAGGREFTNDVISGLFRRLRKAGIFTKAYFIIGGKKETAQSAEQTISFAVSSGATLAYFALYKDFVFAQVELRKDRGVGHPSTAGLLEYDQLMARWDEEFAVPARGVTRDQAVQPSSLRTPSSGSERRAYRKLASMGFRFDDLVKYNDYHAEYGPSGDVLHSVTWGRPDEFFDLVEKAYRTFYLRPEFISDFEALVAAGY